MQLYSIAASKAEKYQYLTTHTQNGPITAEQSPNVHQIVIAYIQMYYTKLYDLKENYKVYWNNSYSQIISFNNKNMHMAHWHNTLKIYIESQKQKQQTLPFQNNMNY